MKITALMLGELGTNCYVVTDELSGHSFIIDPAEYDERLEEVIKNQCRGKVDYVFLTHGHYDHTLGCEKIKETTGAKIAISSEDAEMLTNGEINCSCAFYGFPMTACGCDIEIKDGDIFEVGSLKIRAMSTPGHSEGGMCFITDNSIFSGDTMFYGSYGRYDLYKGSLKKLIDSLKKLLELEGDYNVYPGHGSATTLSNERANY